MNANCVRWCQVENDNAVSLLTQGQLPDDMKTPLAWIPVAVTRTLQAAAFRKLLRMLTSFGAGSLLGAAFLDLLPHALRESGVGAESILRLGPGGTGRVRGGDRA